MRTKRLLVGAVLLACCAVVLASGLGQWIVVSPAMAGPRMPSDPCTDWLTEEWRATPATLTEDAEITFAQNGLPIYEYAPRRVKQSVVGRGGADKGQVGFMVRALLGLDVTPTLDAADALAIGLTHFQTSEGPLRSVVPTPQI